MRHPDQQYVYNHGFTLIELSIVLVIIGLIVGGVLVGKDLIEAARIRSQISQLESFSTMVMVFKNKYNSLPGDMNNATSFGLGPNGNGNQIVDALADQFHFVGENTRFFQHLSNAGITSETFDGTSSIGNGYPRLKYSNNQTMGAGYKIGVPGWGAFYQLSTPAYDITTTLSLHINIGSPEFLGVSSQYVQRTGIFIPLALRSMDTKIDDGVARSGKLLGLTPFGLPSGNCLTGVDGDYLVSNTQTACDAEYIILR